MSTYSPEYYQQNKERITAVHKAWREANPEVVQEQQKNWREANEGRTYVDPKGYVKYIGYEHPNANPSGVTPYHRIILWDAMQGQDAFCHWGCGTWLTWSKKYPEHKDALVVDHLNLDKADNRAENLVPSCNRCNITRPGGQKERTIVRTANLGTCYGPECSRPAKALELCSAHYNQQRLGRDLTPLRSHAAHMTEDQASEVVRRINDGETIVDIAEDMGYHSSAIARAFKRVTGVGIARHKAGAA